MIRRYAGVLLAASVCLGALYGCGGGGGGGAAPADVRGRIMLLSSGSPLSGAVVNVGGSSMTTGTSGAFDVPSVSSASTTITVTATGVKTLTQTLPTLVPNNPNDLGDIFVVDSSSDYTATASGTVVRADTLAPVAGARVLLSGQVAITDASGAFSFTKLPVGLGGTPQVGVITATGFEIKPIFIDPVLGNSPPDNPLGQIALAPPVGNIPGPPSTIRGKITIQGQTDLSGTIVTLTRKSDGASLGSLLTDTSGTYGFFVAAGTYTVTATHAGPPLFQPGQKDVTLTDPSKPQTVDLLLVP